MVEPSKTAITWLRTTSLTKPVILVAEKESYQLLYPEGPNPDFESAQDHLSLASADQQESVADSDDSLFDLLSGRKPLPPKTEQTYTEMVDLDVDAEDTMDDAMEDTFREKRKPAQQNSFVDPLDDSEIF